jgi:hypothetical protein
VLAKVRQSCKVLLGKLRDTQTQLQLLRGCFAACRFTFLLRSTQSALYRPILEQADKVLRETFEGILGAPTSDEQWMQATLSFSEGGLGIESPLIQAGSASVAGLNTWLLDGQDLRPRNAPVADLTGSRETLEWLRGQLGPDHQPLKEWCSTGIIRDVERDHCDQKKWSTLVHRLRKTTLLQESNARDSARLRCQDSTSAGAWSRAPPSVALATKIGRDSYRLMIRWHLGMPVLAQSQAGKPCPLCGEALDIFGDHAAVCRRNNLWKRHFLLQDFMLRLTRAAGFQASREQSLLSSDRREADILIENWEGTRPVAIDLTVRHPRAPGSGFTDPEKTLLKAEEDKRKGAESRAAPNGTIFEPLVFHTWSGVPSTGTSKRFLSQWTTRIVENRPGLDKDFKTNEIQEGLSCILFAQIAEQLEAIRGSNEIPVTPNLRIPEWVDAYGNETAKTDHCPKRVRLPGNTPWCRTTDSHAPAGSSLNSPSTSGAAVTMPAWSTHPDLLAPIPANATESTQSLLPPPPPGKAATPQNTDSSLQELLPPVPVEALQTLFPPGGETVQMEMDLTAGLRSDLLDHLQQLLTEYPPDGIVEGQLPAFSVTAPSNTEGGGLSPDLFSLLQQATRSEVAPPECQMQ